MKKIAILVEPHFMHKHVGVRNLIFSVYKALINNDVLVDFISYDYQGKSISWFKIWLDELSIINNYSNSDSFVEGSSGELIKTYLLDSFQKKAFDNTQEKINIYRIGNSINKLAYDGIIISAPWIITSDIFPIESKLYGIVYDMIPNNYVVDKVNKPIKFAYEHLHGYQLYAKYCKKIFSISHATKKSFDGYFPSSNQISYVLPPAVPNYLRLYQDNDVVLEKENNIILAGPWDPRKGISRIPKLLNPIAKKIDTLFIYGKPRCSTDDIKAFLDGLKDIKKIVWYEEVSNVTLKMLYKKSKILLFPSENEGLGLPLIEAQMQGCRVICTPFESAKEILVSDYYIMHDDDNINIVKIEEMLLENFNYESLSKKSKEFFAEEILCEYLTSLLED
jgi:glycosyltransferase involved in cell wall biosynthesis